MKRFSLASLCAGALIHAVRALAWGKAAEPTRCRVASPKRLGAFVAQLR